MTTMHAGATTPNAAPRIALRGDLLDFAAAPAWGDTEGAGAVRFRPDHWLLVEGGRIVGAQPAPPSPADGWERHDHRGRLILPGFVDTHVHSPQIDVIASYGAQLLDWLERYTFPAELRHADAAHAAQASAAFLDALLAHGPAHLGHILRGMEEWMEEGEYASVAQLKASMSLGHLRDPSALVRQSYIRVLDSFTPRPGMWR